MNIDFERVARGELTLWVRPEWKEIVARDASKYFDGLEGAQTRAIVGRAKHVVYRPAPDRPALFVRRNRRGGAVSFLGGFYAGPERLLDELALLHELAGIPAPRPVGVVARCRLGFVTDSVSLFEEIEGAREILPVLREASRPRDIIEAAARAVASVARAGVHHPDLNIRNIVVRPDGQVFIVDFLGARRSEQSAPLEPAVARLYRSIEKWVPDRAISRQDRWRFVAAAAGDAIGARRLAHACRRGLWRHRLAWAFGGRQGSSS